MNVDASVSQCGQPRASDADADGVVRRGIASPLDARHRGGPRASRGRCTDEGWTNIESSDVVAAFTLDEVLAIKVPAGKPADELSLQERFALIAYQGRSSDLLVALRPYTASPAAVGKYLASHGSPWNYDRRVPILFWWKGAPSQTRFLPVQTVDVAPTLAALLGLIPPPDVDGRCLSLGSLADCPQNVR